MKLRNVYLAVSLLVSILAIAFIMIKGNPSDKVSFNSVSEFVESILHHADKAGHILTSLTDEEEMEVGNKIHKKISVSYGKEKFNNTPIHKYIDEVAQIICKNVKRKKINYKTHILDSFYPEAFALPGGHIYISMGLIAQLKSEAELAAILGHEIVHVDAKHCIGAIQYKIRLEKIIGVMDLDTYVDIGYQIFLKTGYSEFQETEADLGGVYLAYKAGYHPLAAVSVFKRIFEKELSKGEFFEPITPVGDTARATVGLLVRYFSTHPPVPDRIKKIENYIKESMFVKEKSKFYVGEKNHIERTSMKEFCYKEEFKEDYLLLTGEKLVKKHYKEKPVSEVYTFYGRVYKGMDISDIKTILPEKLKVSKTPAAITYKDVLIYDFKNEPLRKEIALNVSLENTRVKDINISSVE